MKHFGKSFLRDVALLLVVTIILGAGFSAAVAYGIDTYFGDTLSNLVGEYGEYQLLVHVQQEARGAAKVQLASLLKKQFPGAKLKEGVAIAGTANFFIALPPQAVTRKVFANLGRLFSDLPGQSGYTVLLEPTVVVQGVQGNVYGELMTEIERLDHVRFAFRQGGQIYVLLAGPQYSQEVTNQIDKILSGYQILEVRFPPGYSVDPTLMGEQLAGALSLELGREVTNVSGSGKNDQLDALVETLTQLKGFLESYATKVELNLEPNSGVKRGSLIGIGEKDTIIGEPFPGGGLVVEVNTVTANRARGIIRKGNSQELLDADGSRQLPAYLLENGIAGAKVGEVMLQNQRVLLGKSLGESKKLLTQLAYTSREAEQAAKGSLATIESFKRTQKQVGEVEKILAQLNGILASPLGKVKQRDLDALMTKTTGAIAQAGKLLAVDGTDKESLPQLSQLLGEILTLTPADHPLRENLEGLLAALQLVSGAGDLGSFSGELQAWRRSLARDVINLMRAERGEQRRQVSVLLASTRKLGEVMGAMDPSPFIPSLKLVEQRARAFSQIDLDGIVGEADKLEKALPQLSDEKITSSLNLVDQYLAGEVSPTGTVSLLVRGGVEVSKARGIVEGQLESNKASLYGMQAGVVKPNMRSEVMRILGEVRLTIAAILIVLIAMLSLVFDHATLIAAFRIWSRNHKNKRQARWLWLEDLLPYLYGGAAGALMLFGMTRLTGAQLPLLPQGGVILLGAAMGIFVGFLAERLSPIPWDEMVAGEAMGLSWTGVLRQIVIPAGRPGLMQLLNSRRVICPRGGKE